MYHNYLLLLILILLKHLFVIIIIKCAALGAVQRWIHSSTAKASISVQCEKMANLNDNAEVSHKEGSASR